MKTLTGEEAIKLLLRIDTIEFNMGEIRYFLRATLTREEKDKLSTLTDAAHAARYTPEGNLREGV